MKTKIIFLCAVFLITQAITYGQKTEVSVQKGKVIAQTAAGTVTVDAGRKAILAQDAEPTVTVDDPMVDELIKMYQWAKAEKQANEIRIDSISIQIVSIENEKLFKGIGLIESPNEKSQPTNICAITGTIVLNNPRFYDLQGNLLSYELVKTGVRHGNYYVEFLESVEPGQKFKYILVSDLTPSFGLWGDGVLWHHVMENNPRYCVNYFQEILPKSAVFVESSRDVILTDIMDGRIAVTTRNYTGSSARGMIHTMFLWPEKDGTTIAELPERFRGLSASGAASLDGKSEVVKKLNYLPWDKAGDDAVALYDEFVNEEVKASEAWFTLGIKLVGGSYFDEAFDSFERCASLSDQKIHPDYVSALIWQGHIYDIWTRREEAISQYERVLEFLEQFRNADFLTDFENLVFMRHDQWRIRLSYKWVKERIEKPFSKELLRANAPTEEMIKINQRLSSLPWKDAGSEAVTVYEQFVNEDVTVGGKWGVLGIKLVGAGYWKQAFDAFQRCHSLDDSTSWRFTSLVWLGHIYDVWDKRDEAISKYQQALELEDFSYMRHDQWGIVLNYEWVKQRLEKPFTKEMVGK